MILRDFDLRLGVDDVLRGQGGDAAKIRARSPALVELAQRALDEGEDLIDPVVQYRRIEVESFSHERLILTGGGVLSGPLIAEHLPSASQVIVAICTIGPKLEQHATSVMSSDLQLGLALDGLGSAAADTLATAACHHFEAWAQQEDFGTTIPLNPGMRGWPVNQGQREIFALLNPEEIGVKLLSAGMMMPLKSLSLVLGVGRDISVVGTPCDYCSMRERCRYRPQ